MKTVLSNESNETLTLYKAMDATLTRLAVVEAAEERNSSLGERKAMSIAEQRCKPHNIQHVTQHSLFLRSFIYTIQHLRRRTLDRVGGKSADATDAGYGNTTQRDLDRTIAAGRKVF
jgi:hypothetical protein